MVFTTAFRYYKNKAPLSRVYVHHSSSMGFDEAVGHVEPALERLVEEGHAPQVLLPGQMEWFLGFLWEDKKTSTPMMDLLGYGDLSEWNGNPSVFSWNLQNGIYVSTWSGFACEEEVILAGKEGEQRRTMSDLMSYFRAPFIGL